MSNQYRSILAGAAGTGGDAVAADVLSGKTFTNDYGSQTGSMTNNGAVTQTLSAGQSYTIPEGYHDGSGTVSAQTPSINNAVAGSISTEGSENKSLYTASGDAKVYVTAVLHCSATNAGDIIAIKKNGTTVKSINLGSNADEFTDEIIDLVSGDTVTATVSMAGSQRIAYGISLSEL